jgi:hypothetical protein
MSWSCWTSSYFDDSSDDSEFDEWNKLFVADADAEAAEEAV